MTLFVLLALALVLLGLAFVAWPLLRTRSLVSEDRDRQNIAIARERVADLEAELREGILGQDEFEQAKEEVESALLIDMDQRDDGEGAKAADPGTGTFVALALAVPVVTVLLYLQLGEPKWIDREPMEAAPVAGAGHDEQTMPSVDEMIERLSRRLTENPQDAEGWFMMGRTMMVLQQYDKAVPAMEKTLELTGDQPTVMLALADAIAMNQQGSMAGRPTELVNRALAQEPQNSTALWMSAMALEEEGDYVQALSRVAQLRPLLSESPDELAEVAKLEQHIRGKMDGGEAEPAAVATESTPAEQTADRAAAIQVRVELAEELATQVRPSDTLFIFARAVQGPRFPVSIARLTAGDLPAETVLDDSGSVMGNIKLSDFENVNLEARISRSGNAMPQSGDIRGMVENVPVDGKDRIRILLNTPIP
jgi:cytochrome c-type biogenesis protein CcmH